MGAPDSETQEKPKKGEAAVVALDGKHHELYDTKDSGMVTIWAVSIL